jgi:thymidylate kinase
MAITELRISPEQCACSELLLRVCARLDRAGIAWCVPHGYAAYPEDVNPNDVDMVVRPEHFGDLPNVLAGVPGARLVQFRVHDGGTSIRYDLASHSTGGAPVLLGIDVSSDIRDLGTVLMSAEEFFAERRRFRGLFWVPRPAVEFGHYLLKKLAKSARFGPEALDARHAATLSRLYGEDPEGCRRQLDRFFPRAEAQLIAAAAERHHWEAARTQITRLRRAAARRVRLAHPGNLLRYWAGDLVRGIRRVLQPTGLVIAFLGLDGSGKSATIARIVETLGQAFSSEQRYHVRPHIFRPERDEIPPSPVMYPPPRGPLLSLAKLGLWWLDYSAGHLVRIVPGRVRSTLIVFDRYYDDLLVDPRRYRFGGSPGLARMVGRYLPHPDLLIVLDGPPALACARKPGLGLAEAARQRNAYVALARGVRGGHVVDASGPLDEVVARVSEIILDHMSRRTARRLGLSA